LRYDAQLQLRATDRELFPGLETLHAPQLRGRGTLALRVVLQNETGNRDVTP
jgi:hypothetical protein